MQTNENTPANETTEGQATGDRYQLQGEIARGLPGYSADEIPAMAGLRASDIAGRLGYNRGDAVIHRNDLVLL